MSLVPNKYTFELSPSICYYQCRFFSFCIPPFFTLMSGALSKKSQLHSFKPPIRRLPRAPHYTPADALPT